MTKAVMDTLSPQMKLAPPDVAKIAQDHWQDQDDHFVGPPQKPVSKDVLHLKYFRK